MLSLSVSSTDIHGVYVRQNLLQRSHPHFSARSRLVFRGNRCHVETVANLEGYRQVVVGI